MSRSSHLQSASPAQDDLPPLGFRGVTFIHIKLTSRNTYLVQPQRRARALDFAPHSRFHGICCYSVSLSQKRPVRPAEIKSFTPAFPLISITPGSCSTPDFFARDGMSENPTALQCRCRCVNRFLALHYSIVLVTSRRENLLPSCRTRFISVFVTSESNERADMASNFGRPSSADWERSRTRAIRPYARRRSQTTKQMINKVPTIPYQNILASNPMPQVYAREASARGRLAIPRTPFRFGRASFEPFRRPVHLLLRFLSSDFLSLVPALL
jgi:hypothetical protein